MATYPTPDIAGPVYVRYIKHRKDYGEITVFSVFEDGSRDALTHAADAPQRWTLVYQGLTQTQLKVILDHYDAHRLSTKFTFKEPRNDPWTGTAGTTYTNLVQYEVAPEQPEHLKVWAHGLTVKLVKYPA